MNTFVFCHVISERDAVIHFSLCGNEPETVVVRQAARGGKQTFEKELLMPQRTCGNAIVRRHACDSWNSCWNV